MRNRLLIVIGAIVTVVALSGLASAANVKHKTGYYEAGIDGMNGGVWGAASR